MVFFFIWFMMLFVGVMIDGQHNEQGDESEIKVSPGETLREYLINNNVSKKEFSEKSNIPIVIVNKIITGEIKINKELAQRISAATGLPAEFWLGLERDYRK